MVLNQNKGKGQEEEKPRRRRNIDFDEHSERRFCISSTDFNKEIKL